MNIIPEHGRRRVRQGRDPAGAAVRGAVRLLPAQVRRPRHAGVRPDREDLARAVRDRRRHHEGGADRRVRRDGVHDRQVRRRLAAVARQADGHVLPDLPGVHPRGARPHRPVPRLFDPEVHPVHQGRAADRAGHVVVRIGAAADDGQDGEPGREEVDRRPRHPDRLLVQSRRHVDLPDDGRGVHRPGDQHAHDAHAAAHAAGGAAADVQGRRRRHRQRLHRAGGDAVGGRPRAGRRAGADPRHRPLHVGGARA